MNHEQEVTVRLANGYLLDNWAPGPDNRNHGGHHWRVEDGRVTEVRLGCRCARCEQSVRDRIGEGDTRIVGGSARIGEVEDG